ncbi:MAG: LysE family translocator [Muribaculaceae bacterium]|nr:LysE family translocator [Muribaculaceae bacterium]
MNFIEGIIYMIWRGIAIGIIISAPMGPVGILCVQRTLEKGRRTGLFTGIGAAISDMFYCLLTGFGLSFIEEFLTRNHDIIQLLGSVVLIGFGIYLFKSNPSRKLRKPDEGISDKRNILNGFLFTFSNPLIIFLIIGLFARFNFFMPEIKFYHYIIGFLAIGAGALIWWWVVTFFVAKLRSHFNLRSMWLINKIIGSIIFIFAIVGIVTAVSAMCEAAPRSAPPKIQDSLYLNSSRGFGSFRHAADSSLVIEAQQDTVFDLIPLSNGRSFAFSFRAANLHNASGKSYPVATSVSSRGRKVRNPGWGIVIAGGHGNREIISIKTDDNPKDETYSPTALSISASSGSGVKRMTDGVDSFTGENAFHLSFDRGELTLMGGNREYNPIMSWNPQLGTADSIGFFVSPGALISLDWISLEYPGALHNKEKSEYGDKDILSSYLKRSEDPLEGIWKVFDRTLDEDYLRMGGDYSLALIRSPQGYNFYYLEGAQTLSSDWQPGMIKARLMESGFPGIYDVEWLDAAGSPLSNEIKAQFESPLLTIIFPYQSSTLRLRKL